MPVDSNQVIRVVETEAGKTEVTATEPRRTLTIEKRETKVVSQAKQGPPGPGADKNYTQPIDGQTVTIMHNLNKRPSVTVLDSAGDEVVGTVRHISPNELQLIFSAPFSGVVICN